MRYGLSKDTDLYGVYPISWVTKSGTLMDYVSLKKSEDVFMVADFASGEHDRVPSFFVKVLPKMQFHIPKRILVYCIDIHAMRLDSLMGKLEESGLLDYVRVVQAKLETMDEEANLRPDMVEYLVGKDSNLSELDHHLRAKRFIPDDVFDIGVLNNDIVGYLQEYYKDNSSALLSLQKVYQSLKKDALLIVTMPCSLYIVDNIEILESVGFEFLEGKDIDLSTGRDSEIQRDSDLRSLSQLGHYTFLLFIKK